METPALRGRPDAGTAWLTALGPALRYAGETRGADLGRDRRAVHGRGARLRARGRSASRATTTRSCTSTGSSRATITPYEVRARRRAVWPLPDSGYPPSVDPHARPATSRRGSSSAPAASARRTSRRTRCPRTSTPTAARSTRCARSPSGWRRRTRPSGRDALILLGDQVYADEVSPEVREFIRSRRDPEVPPGETVADFEEYTRLYRESWARAATSAGCSPRCRRR